MTPRERQALPWMLPLAAVYAATAAAGVAIGHYEVAIFGGVAAIGAALAWVWR